jgi:uncharacterized membrane protein HdeD (DUF308 family)
MLSVLAGERWLILLRSGLAMLFGVLVLLWPEPTPPGFAVLFALYALVNAAVALIMTFGAGDTPGFAGLLVEGIGGVVVGLAITLYPGMTGPALVVLIAIWALIVGIAAMVTAGALPRDTGGDLPLATQGFLSFILAALLFRQVDSTHVTVALLISVYAVAAGLCQLALTVRMHQIVRDMERA